MQDQPRATSNNEQNEVASHGQYRSKLIICVGEMLHTRGENSLESVMKSKIRVKPIKYATKKSIVKARRLPFLIFGFLDQSLPACNTSQN